MEFCGVCITGHNVINCQIGITSLIENVNNVNNSHGGFLTWIIKVYGGEATDFFYYTNSTLNPTSQIMSIPSGFKGTRS